MQPSSTNDETIHMKIAILKVNVLAIMKKKKKKKQIRKWLSQTFHLHMQAIMKKEK
jgi:hypothetical protein